MTPRQKKSSTSSQYAAGMYSAGTSSAYGSLGNVSSGSGGGAGPAPTTKPPTPPQANRAYNSGTLNRSKEYRTPPVVAPPQVPSNYAPNYPRQQPQQQQHQQRQQYGTLPHPQVQMVHPVQQQQEDLRYHGATMPRLSSASMRSTGSQGSSSGGEPTYMRHQQVSSSTLGRASLSGGQYGVLNNRSSNPQMGMPPPQSTPPINRPASSSQYAPSNIMTRPSQRPPSPPLPPPPQQMSQQIPQQQQYNPVYARHSSVNNSDIYSRQSSVGSSMQAMDSNSIYSR